MEFSGSASSINHVAGSPLVVNQSPTREINDVADDRNQETEGEKSDEEGEFHDQADDLRN
jgi:hypothetical protein